MINVHCAVVPAYLILDILGLVYVQIFAELQLRLDFTVCMSFKNVRHQAINAVNVFVIFFSILELHPDMMQLDHFPLFNGENGGVKWQSNIKLFSSVVFNIFMTPKSNSQNFIMRPKTI